VGARQNFGAGGEDAITQQGGHVILPPAIESVTYDFDGNVTSDGRWNYAWDGENRLLSMESLTAVPAAAKQRLEFAYDAASRRIQKKVYVWNISINAYELQSTTKFVYEDWDLLAEIDANNALIRDYTRGGRQLVFIGAETNVYEVGYDGNENVGAVMNANTGELSASYDYDPFGQTLRAVGELSSKNPFRFSNYYTDSETGLIYCGYRFYSPENGRWVSKDPLDVAGGVNLYAFVSNNGVGKIDLFGLTDYDSIAGQQLNYSCNCGWIDWNHANPVPGDPYSTAQLWDAINNEKGIGSAVGPGHYVQYGQSFFVPFTRRKVAAYYSGGYYVKNNLSWNQKVGVALGIVKEVSEGFETLQWLGRGNSSFSEEDLVSDLIALNMAIFGYSREQIDQICNALDVPRSQRIYEDNFGRNGSLGKSRSWTPKYYDCKQCKYCSKESHWPHDRLYQMQPIPKGELWRTWYPKDRGWVKN
jgi:RHS repeat-associated protein